MDYIKVKAGQKVFYKGSMPYKMSNGQEAEPHKELEVKNDILVQKRFFEVLKEKQNNEPKNNLDEMNKDELAVFAEENKIEIDKRQGEDKIREAIKKALKK